jgi:hypothetical protein
MEDDRSSFVRNLARGTGDGKTPLICVFHVAYPAEPGHSTEAVLGRGCVKTQRTILPGPFLCRKHLLGQAMKDTSQGHRYLRHDRSLPLLLICKNAPT